MCRSRFGKNKERNRGIRKRKTGDTYQCNCEIMGHVPMNCEIAGHVPIQENCYMSPISHVPNFLKGDTFRKWRRKRDTYLLVHVPYWFPKPDPDFAEATADGRRGAPGRRGHVKGRAFGSPLARDLYPRASTAEVDPRASPGPRPLSNHQPRILVTGG